MKYPSLIPDFLCQTVIKEIVFYSDNLQEDGSSKKIKYNNLKCNFQANNRVIFQNNKQETQITGKLLFPVKRFKEVDVSSKGKVSINNKTYEIKSTQPWRNPDGTINYYEVLII